MRIAVCRKLFAAVHRKREGVCGEEVSAAQQSHGGGQGGWVHAQLFVPNSLSLLCSQKRVSPATGTCAT